MKQSVTLKPQDVAVLCKLIALGNDSFQTSDALKPWRQVDLAKSTEIAQGEIAKSLRRLGRSNLVRSKKVNRRAALEFLIYAVKYMFPVEVGAIGVGVPTGTGAPMHDKMVYKREEVYVWPYAKGSHRGQVIRPFYAKLAEAALIDEEFYGLMAAIEILRLGRARERNQAIEYLERKILKGRHGEKDERSNSDDR